MATEAKKPDATEMQKMVAELESANEAEREATEEERAASSKTRLARERVSNAQKALDAAVASLRSGAPWSTHWSDSRRRGEPVS